MHGTQGGRRAHMHSRRWWSGRRCRRTNASSGSTLVFFFTLVAGHRRSLSLKLSDTRVYAPQIPARLGTTAYFCEVVSVLIMPCIFTTPPHPRSPQLLSNTLFPGTHPAHGRSFEGHPGPVLGAVTPFLSTFGQNCQRFPKNEN